VPIPLDLLDGEGGWFRFPTLAGYVKAQRDRPPATNCALLVGHSLLRLQAMADVARPAAAAEK
jgi:N-acyl-D-amino-acid deacylase